MFGDENAKEVVIKKPYEEQRKEFQKKLVELKRQTLTPNDVDSLAGEQEMAQFVKTFRDLLRIKSSLETFAEFSFEDLGISEQEFYDYQSKYLDLYEKVKQGSPEKESILDEIDFELELTVRDVVNFDYIIQLIVGLKGISSDKLRQKKTEEILSIFDRDLKLRKKKELVRKFIEENLPHVRYADDVEQAFHRFWDEEKMKNIEEVAREVGILTQDLHNIIGEYLYTQKLPLSDEIVELVPRKIGLLEQETIIQKVKKAIKNIVDVFEW